MFSTLAAPEGVNSAGTARQGAVGRCLLSHPGVVLLWHFIHFSWLLLLPLNKPNEVPKLALTPCAVCCGGQESLGWDHYWEA